MRPEPDTPSILDISPAGWSTLFTKTYVRLVHNSYCWKQYESAQRSLINLYNNGSSLILQPPPITISSLPPSWWWRHSKGRSFTWSIKTWPVYFLFSSHLYPHTLSSSYFNYKVVLRCGVPSVTLEGEKSDWVTILSRLTKLESFGPEPKAWAALLRPILNRFIKAFDGDPDIDFWNQVCHYYPQGSGPTYLSGWITAFCVWRSDGTWQGPSLQPKVSTAPSWVEKLVLDKTQYPIIETGDVPSGFCQVDVALDDNGELFDCLMVAGHLAGLVTGEEKDTLQPLPSWFIFIKESTD